MASTQDRANASLWWHIKAVWSDVFNRESWKLFWEGAVTALLIGVLVLTTPISLPLIAWYRRRTDRISLKEFEQKLALSENATR